MKLVSSFVVLASSCLLAASAVAAEPPASSAPKPAAPAAAAPATPPAARAETADYHVAPTQAIHAIVLPMKGSYDQHQAAFERVAGYLAGKSVAPVGEPFARYLNDASGGEANLQWEVGLPVAAGVTAEAPFELRDVPAGTCAIHVHRGSYEELATAWPPFVQWILANGYQPAGPPLQVFKGDFSTPNVELRMPVSK